MYILKGVLGTGQKAGSTQTFSFHQLAVKLQQIHENSGWILWQALPWICSTSNTGMFQLVQHELAAECVGWYLLIMIIAFILLCFHCQLRLPLNIAYSVSECAVWFALWKRPRNCSECLLAGVDCDIFYCAYCRELISKCVLIHTTHNVQTSAQLAVNFSRICVKRCYWYFCQVKEILQEEEDLSEIVQLVGKVGIMNVCYDSRLKPSTSKRHRSKMLTLGMFPLSHKCLQRAWYAWSVYVF